ncbi:hypothetical protein [Streptomyces geranii]|uniref:hypothetical protein n=1 Tax=Streptomyces geranii TaxID=2058923 RepID=UPI00130073C7|nr:hypothetical protein [Streptomyces geranii]
MFDITFDAHSMRKPREKKLAKLGQASEMNLRYGYFETDLTFTVGEFGSEDLPGVTILDFIFCLLYAAREVRQGNVGEIGFTENDQVIRIIPNGEIITVSRSWSKDSGDCGVDVFFAVVARFCSDVLGFIVEQYPAFQENLALSKLVSMLAEFQR